MTTPTAYAHGVRAMLEMYESAQRGTGRTTQLIASLRDGDAVVVPTHRDKRQFEDALLRTFDKSPVVRIVVADPDAPSSFSQLDYAKRNTRGRLHYTHEWKFEYAKRLLTRAAEEVDAL